MSLNSRLSKLEALHAGPLKIVVVWSHEGKRYADRQHTIEAPEPDPDAIVLNVVSASEALDHEPNLTT